MSHSSPSTPPITMLAISRSDPSADSLPSAPTVTIEVMTPSIPTRKTASPSSFIAVSSTFLGRPRRISRPIMPPTITEIALTIVPIYSASFLSLYVPCLRGVPREFGFDAQNAARFVGFHRRPLWICRSPSGGVCRWSTDGDLSDFSAQRAGVFCSRPFGALYRYRLRRRGLPGPAPGWA